MTSCYTSQIGYSKCKIYHLKCNKLDKISIYSSVYNDGLLINNDFEDFRFYNDNFLKLHIIKYIYKLILSILIVMILRLKY